MSHRVLEVTDAQRKREFIKQINGLIRNTGKFERDKVDRMIDLLNRARADLQQTIISAGRKNKFTRQTAIQLRKETERLMAEFQARAELQMNAAQQGISDIASDTIDAIAKSQGRRSSLLGIKPQLVEIAQGRSASLIKSLARKNIGRVSDIVNRGVLTGKSVFEVGTELSNEFGKSLAQMETIARTEMLGIHGATTFAEIQAMAETSPGLQKQWISVIDERTRLGHKTPTDAGGAHLQTVPVEDFFLIPQTIRSKTGFSLGPVDSMLYPRDPNGTAGNIINCFLPGTLVQGVFVAASRVWYSGEVVRIRTARGFEVAVTPNHPIFTTRRMAPAFKIRKGEYLLGYKTGKERGFSNINVDQPPTRIEDVFSAFAELGTERRSARDTDFHGDGKFIQGEIEIVSLQGELLRDFYPSSPKLKSEIIFKRSPKKTSSEPGLSPGDSSFDGIALAQPRGPRSSALGLNGFLTSRTDALPFQHLSIGTASQIDLSCYKSTSKSRTANPGLVTERLHGGTAAILSRNFSNIGNLERSITDVNPGFGEGAVNIAATDSEFVSHFRDRRPVVPAFHQGIQVRNYDSFITHGHTMLPEQFVDSFMVDADFPAKLQDRFSELVFPDKVVKIRYDYFSGHVYDLQSPYGHMVANYTFQKQCRCTLIPDFSNVDPPGLSLVEMPPISIPLSDLTGEVEKSVRKGFRNLR